MADTKISALDAGVTPTTTDTLAVNQGSTLNKITFVVGPVIGGGIILRSGLSAPIIRARRRNKKRRK